MRTSCKEHPDSVLEVQQDVASVNNSLTTSKGKVLLLAYHYPPAIAAGAQRAVRFSRYLPSCGYPTKVIANRVPSARDTDTVTYVGLTDGFLGERGAFIARVIQRLYSAYNDRLEWVSGAIRAADRLMAHEPFDSVISSSPPICTHLVALWLKLRYRVKWIADFRDPFAASPDRTALRNRITDAFIQTMLFTFADAVVGVTDVMVEQWRRATPTASTKLAVIWNGFDPHESLPKPGRALHSRKVIAHVGDCYGDRHPTVLLESLARLAEKELIGPTSIRVDLIGPLDPDSPLRAMSSFSRLTAEGRLRHMESSIPRIEALQATADADYLLLLDLHDIKYGMFVPSKLFDYVRAGRPILAFTPKASCVAILLEKCGIPFTCVYPDDSEDEVDRKVLTFLGYASGPFQASEYFDTTFDGRRQTESLAAVLDRLLSC